MSDQTAEQIASSGPNPPHPSADDSVANCVALLERGFLTGRRLSVGTYTTAVPSHHTWAVLNRMGRLLFLARDSSRASSGSPWSIPIAMDGNQTSRSGSPRTPSRPTRFRATVHLRPRPGLRPNSAGRTLTAAETVRSARGSRSPSRARERRRSGPWLSPSIVILPRLASGYGSFCSAPRGKPAARARVLAFLAPPARTRVPPKNAGPRPRGAGATPLWVPRRQTQEEP
jgi:hypothetical protein